jgi:exonuclease VII large subunit
MRTGYTSYICDGKITDLKEFAALCIRNFGICFEQRDEPLSTDLPTTFEVSPTYEELVHDAESNLEKWRNLTDDEIKAKFQEFYDKELANLEEELQTQTAQKTMVDDWISRLSSWEPHKEWTGFKEFMIEQLSLLFKYDLNPASVEKEIQALKSETARLWHQRIQNEMEWSVESRQESLQEHIELVASKNASLVTLLESLEALS